MSDDLCRVSIHTGHEQRTTTVDLALPSSMPVGELIPAIVDAVGAAADVTARRWRLSRIGGPALDDAETLADQDIVDGALLLLSTTSPPAPVFDTDSPATTVAAAAHDGHRVRWLRTAACLWAATGGAMSLAWSRGTGPMVTAAVLTAAVGIAAVVAWRTRPDPALGVPLNLVVVLLAAVTGLLIVPAGPAAPDLLLAAAAAAATSVLLVRVTGAGVTWLTGAAVFAATATIAMAAAVGWSLPVEALGALLTVLALGGLGISPRLSILLAGLSPTLPGVDDPGDDPPPAPDDERVRRGHHILTGLVMGSAGAATLGVALVAVGYLRTPSAWFIDGAFCVGVGLVLLLRARSHAGGFCRTALILAGMGCLTAAFVIVVVVLHDHRYWAGALAVAAGLAAVAPVEGPGNPVARRTVDTVEYLALGAVVPLACAVSDVFALARGLSLT